MPITQLEVWDDAIKIGLGVLFGGIFTILSLIVSHHYKIKEGKIQRRTDVLEKVSSDITKLNYLAVARIAALSTSLRYPDRTKAWQEKLNSLSPSLEEAAEIFFGVESQLYLLGLKNISDLVVEYRLRFPLHDAHARSLSEADFQQLKIDLEKLKHSIFEALKKAYKN